MTTPNTTPIYPGTPWKAGVALATANAARDGSGTLTTLHTFGASGGFVEKIQAMSGIAAGSPSTAMVIRWWKVPSGGGNGTLLAEATMASVTPSATAIGASTGPVTINTPFGPLDVLAVTQTAAETVHHSSQGGDY